MNKLYALPLLLAFFAATRPVKAQEQVSKFEVYGGYYYARFSVNASAVGGAPSETFNGNGGASSSNTTPTAGSA
jgi:hypothetical protein